MYVWMYVCMYVCMFACMYVNMHGWMSMSLYKYVCVCLFSLYPVRAASTAKRCELLLEQHTAVVLLEKGNDLL